MQCSVAGLGNPDGSIHVYIANRPDFLLEGREDRLVPVNADVIQAINAACGNGWRKVFNVYSKWVYALTAMQWESTSAFASWQLYRDKRLLVEEGDTALWFTPPDCFTDNKLTIVMGKTYARELGLENTVEWVTEQFAFCANRNLLVTPYFDYRQLTNERIGLLNHLIKTRLSRFPFSV